MKSAALIVALAATSFAQQWEFEQVDSAARYVSSANVRFLPDGRLSLCYNLNSGTIVFALKDSTWHRESLAVGGNGASYDVSALGEVGVAYPVGSGKTVYARRTDSGWVSESVSLTGSYGAQLSYDRLGQPYILQTDGFQVYGAARTGDSSWTSELVVPFTPGLVGWGYVTFGPARFDRDDHPLVCSVEDVDFNMQVYWGFVHLRTKTAGPWQETWTGGGYHDDAAAASVETDSTGNPVTCYSLASQGFMCAGDRLGEPEAPAVMRLDSLDWPHVVYSDTYAYRDPRGWHKYSLNYGASDFVLGDDGQPIVVLPRQDGLWLAHGVDIVGQSEEPQEPTANGLRLTASVIRNVLFLPLATSYKPQAARCLLDITGRNVLALHPGANDVGDLAPGIYFLTECGARFAVHARKIVLTR